MEVIVRMDMYFDGIHGDIRPSVEHGTPLYAWLDNVHVNTYQSASHQSAATMLPCMYSQS